MTNHSVDIVVLWAGTPIAVERLDAGERFTIGAAPPADRHFVCEHESIPDARFPLVEGREDGVVVRSRAGMELLVDGRALASSEITLGRDARAVVRVGPFEIGIASGRREPRALVRLRDAVDGRLLRVSGIALAMHAGLMVALLVTNAPATSLDDLQLLKGRIAQTILRPSAPVRTQAAATTATTAEAAPSPSTPKARAARAPGKPGGTPRSPDMRALASSFVQLLTGGDARSSVFGGNGPSLGALRGGPGGVGEAGLGLRDLGGGGGGDPVGIGGLDGRLGSGGTCDDCDVGLPTRPPRRAVITHEVPEHDDGLTRDEIQRVMRRAIPQIKHCYEKELGGAPDLEGKVVSSWTIVKSGEVTAARASEDGVGQAVAGCVTRVIGRLKFPAPRGGTQQVQVTYPFVFESAGD